MLLSNNLKDMVYKKLVFSYPITCIKFAINFKQLLKYLKKS